MNEIQADASEQPENEKDQIELALARKKMKFWMLIGGMLMLSAFLLAGISYFLLKKNDEKIADVIRESAEEPGRAVIADLKNAKTRLLDGMPVESGSENIHPIAFMIDNHVDARPQFGLDKAQLVIEAEAEGGITRFLVFFSTDEPIDKIGPIRSARPYFIDWSGELSALYVHVGGSPDALAKMAKENSLHINEFYSGEYFWRGKDFAAPHNVFSSLEKMKGYLAKKDLSEGKFLAWRFKPEEEKDRRGTSTEITIDYFLPDFRIVWHYDRESNEYVRYLGDKKQLASGGSEISAKNIIAQFVKSEVIDEEKRQYFRHIGEGKALVCRDGFCRDGVWRKKSAQARTRFYDSGGQEFEFNAGVSWIQIVGPGQTRVE